MHLDVEPHNDYNQCYEMKFILKSRKPKMLMGLKVHQDGFLPINCLEWQSAVTQWNSLREIEADANWLV